MLQLGPVSMAWLQIFWQTPPLDDLPTQTRSFLQLLNSGQGEPEATFPASLQTNPLLVAKQASPGSLQF